MKRITLQKILLIAVVILIEMLSAGMVFSQWVVQSSGVSVNLYDMKFINRNTGWAVGENGTILKTANGGINWNLVDNPSFNMGKILNEISVIDSNIAYVVGAHSTYLKTTNGGENWIVIRNGPWGSGMGFRSVFYINKDTGWAVGDYRVLLTRDGGISFDSVSLTVMIYNYIHTMHFKNYNTGIASCDGECYKTTNGGYNWFNTQVPVPALYPFMKISVVGDYVWLVGNGKKVYRSTNYAESWDTVSYIPSYPPSMIRSSYFVDINTGWAGGSYGYLYKTTNGGYNWIRENTVGDQRFWGSIWFYNDSIGWGSGGAGKIMHTTTGGQSLVNISLENEHPVAFELSQNYPNPFNSNTNVKFQIINSGVVILKVFDLLGREVKTLVNEYKQPGTYQVSFNAEGLSSGVYFYKIIAGDFSETKKMILIR